MNDCECPNCLTNHSCGHEELIDMLVNWSKAYPLSIFPAPDLTNHDPSRCAAAMGRHIIGRLMEAAALTPGTTD